MDDSMDGNDKTGGTLRTRGPAPRGGEGRVKQSFSHGRSKSVVVETKARKRGVWGRCSRYMRHSRQRRCTRHRSYTETVATAVTV